MKENRKAPDLPMQVRAAAVAPATVNEEERTVELVWTTGAAVRRYDFWEDEVFEEVLSLERGHVRMERMNAGTVPLLRDHRQSVDNVIGVVLSASIANGEGRALVRLDGGDEEADRLFRKVRDGIIRNVSVGYRVYIYEVTREDGKLPVYRATDWEPVEVSLVSVPADAGAGIRSGAASAPCEVVERAQRAELKEDQDMGKDTEVRAQDPQAPVETTTRQQETVNIDAVRAEAISAERTRVAEIRKIVTRHPSLGEDFAARHIEAGTAVEEVRSAALDALGTKDAETEVRSAVQVGESGDDPAVVRRGLVGALAHAMSPRVKLEGPAERFRGYSPLSIAQESLRIQGRSPSSLNREVVVRAALHSTSDFPLLLVDAANMVLQQEYELANPSYRQIAAMRSFNDFKPHKFLTAGDFPDLEKVTEDGEITAGTMSENKETVTLETWARKIGVTRQVLVNDSLGAFADFPRMAARRVAAKENAIVFSLLAQNSGTGPALSDGKALFHADHANKAGTAGAINVTTLGAARAAMRKQTSVDGLPLNINAKILLVGPDKETEAEQITASIIAAQSGNVNPFSGKLTVVADASISGNKWYTFADPMDAEVLVYGYLNGNSAPQMATREGWDVDGVEFRLIHDFAAGAIEYRGAYYNAGA